MLTPRLNPILALVFLTCVACAPRTTPGLPTVKPAGSSSAPTAVNPTPQPTQPPAPLPGSSVIRYSNLSVILGRPTANSITLSLLSDVANNETIAYGTVSHSGTYHAYVSLQADRPQNVVLTGLAPDTTYYYSIINADTGSDEHTFHTQRATGSPFAFTIDADPHNRDPRFDAKLFAATLTSTLADHPDFHIDLGDTFMTEKVQAKTYTEAESTFTDMRPYFGILGADVPLFLVNGNHEGELGWLLTRGNDKNLPIWSAQLRQLYYPNPVPNDFYTGGSIPDPMLGSPRDGYYAWTWGDALFVVLDPFWYTTDKPRPDDLNTNWNCTLGKAQYDWLKSTLEASQSKYKFIFIHNLVGGSDKDSRGGIEAAPYFEWGGKNADGTYGFDEHRPGWGVPIHQLLVQNHVSAVFHGHDHVFVMQELDGVIYQEVPQSSNAAADNTNLAADYGYLQGEVVAGSGHLRVTVTPEEVRVDFIHSYPDKPDVLAYSFSIP